MRRIKSYERCGSTALLLRLSKEAKISFLFDFLENFVKSEMTISILKIFMERFSSKFDNWRFSEWLNESSIDFYQIH